MKEVEVEVFTDEIFNTFKKYTDDVIDAVKEDIKETANDGKMALRKVILPDASISGTAKPSNRRVWKEYSKGWTVTTNGDKNANYIRSHIHNKKHYRLTHLLEYGHDTRDGKHTRAFRHIGIVEEYCIDKIQNEIPKIIEKGGKL